MEFIRIDENTVRCIVTEEDMQEYDVEIDDFLKNRSKVQEFLHLIVEKASDEIGYEPKDGMLAMQIMMLPKNRLAITFSENMEENGDLSDLIQQVAGATVEKAASLKELLDEKTESRMDEEKKPERKLPVQMEIFSFECMDDFGGFCAVISDKLTVKSSLYKDNKGKKYYAILEKGRLSKANYSVVCRAASEYGRHISDRQIRRAYIEEHCSCLLPQRAVKIIKKINMADF